jgi:hypothetical protein
MGSPGSGFEKIDTTADQSLRNAANIKDITCNSESLATVVQLLDCD